MQKNSFNILRYTTTTLGDTNVGIVIQFVDIVLRMFFKDQKVGQEKTMRKKNEREIIRDHKRIIKESTR